MIPIVSNNGDGNGRYQVAEAFAGSQCLGKGSPPQPAMKYVIFNPTTNELFLLLGKGFADKGTSWCRFDWNWDTVRLVCVNTPRGERSPLSPFPQLGISRPISWFRRRCVYCDTHLIRREAASSVFSSLANEWNIRCEEKLVQGTPGSFPWEYRGHVFHCREFLARFSCYDGHSWCFQFIYLLQRLQEVVPLLQWPAGLPFPPILPCLLRSRRKTGGARKIYCNEKHRQAVARKGEREINLQGREKFAKNAQVRRK